MTNRKRPRVAAIELDDSELESIAPLCGELRPAESLSEYLWGYSWTETDVMVSRVSLELVDPSVNLMTVGPIFVTWPEIHSARRHYARSTNPNTEREMSVPPTCPDLYKPLATELSGQLGRAIRPPHVVDTSRQGKTSLIETTSGSPVALRLALPVGSEAAGGEPPSPIALLLPESSNLVAWLKAFLFELNQSDPSRVPHAPPRLNQPSDWYTPEEKALASRISHMESEIKRLTTERHDLQGELVAEGERADRGIRRVLWADGDDLVAAVRDILANLGFVVRDMDAELKQGEPRREDLRLTHEETPGWEAIVEVKGYTSGTKTSDARQIREHRDRYSKEEGRPPDLTLWLSNPYRAMEPSSRPAPDQNVKDTAAGFGFVHAVGPDLYRQWTLVAAVSLDAETVVQSLVNADPGLWTPPTPGT